MNFQTDSKTTTLFTFRFLPVLRSFEYFSNRKRPEFFLKKQVIEGLFMEWLESLDEKRTKTPN